MARRSDRYCSGISMPRSASGRAPTMRGCLLFFLELRECWPGGARRSFTAANGHLRGDIACRWLFGAVWRVAAQTAARRQLAARPLAS
jgi:hypothetical protein